MPSGSSTFCTIIGLTAFGEYSTPIEQGLAMEISYVSYWQRIVLGDGPVSNYTSFARTISSLPARLSDIKFRLSGVIAADDFEIKARFRNRELSGNEWSGRDLLRMPLDKADITRHRPSDWLRQISEQGNGITDEYTDVRQIDAPSLDEALPLAWQAVVSEYGGEEISLYEMPISGSSTNHSRPFSDELPEELLRSPLETNRAATADDNSRESHLELAAVLAQNPWRDLPDHAPYILSDDRPLVQEYNTSVEERHRAVLRIPPHAFVGYPEFARLLILTKNSHWDEQNVDDCNRHPDYLQAMKDGLQITHQRYPFFFLNPRFEDTFGAQWWTRRLNDLIHEFRIILGSEEAAKEHLAQRIMTVAYFPYHVEQYSGHLDSLASQEFSFKLVNTLAGRGIRVVVSAHRREWLEHIQVLREGTVRLKSPQSGYLSERNIGPEDFALLVGELRR